MGGGKGEICNMRISECPNELFQKIYKKIRDAHIISPFVFFFKSNSTRCDEALQYFLKWILRFVLRILENDFWSCDWTFWIFIATHRSLWWLFQSFTYWTITAPHIKERPPQCILVAYLEINTITLNILQCGFQKYYRAWVFIIWLQCAMNTRLNLAFFPA